MLDLSNYKKKTSYSEIKAGKKHQKMTKYNNFE